MHRVLAPVVALAVSSAPTAADQLHTVDTRVSTSALNVRTDSCDVLDAFPAIDAILIKGMAYDPSTDRLFGATPAVTSGLYEIDRDSGEMILAGVTGAQTYGLAIHPTTFELYGMSLTGTLYVLDKVNLIATPVGSDPAFAFAHGLCFTADGTLYASDTFGSGTSRLYTVDPANGDATFVATINRDFVVSLDAGSDGQLYGADNGTHAIITIDRETGDAQTVCQLDSSFALNFVLIGCFELITEEVVCHADGSLFTYNVEGRSSCTGETMSFSFTGSTGAAGQELCFTVIVDDTQGGFCCTTELCVTIPDCTPAALPSDLDGDGIVGMVDFLALLAAWGACSDCGACPADFDADCTVGILDLLVLLGHWGA